MSCLFSLAKSESDLPLRTHNAIEPLESRAGLSYCHYIPFPSGRRQGQGRDGKNAGRALSLEGNLMNSFWEAFCAGSIGEGLDILTWGLGSGGHGSILLALVG